MECDATSIGEKSLEAACMATSCRLQQWRELVEPWPYDLSAKHKSPPHRGTALRTENVVRASRYAYS